MQIKIITFHKLRTPGLAEAYEYYARNIQAFTKKPLVSELPSEKSTDRTDATRAQVLQSEQKMIDRCLQKPTSASSALWVLSERGQTWTSKAWSTELGQLELHGTKELNILIGGPFGLSDDLMHRASKKISFGCATLSHELARVVLMEQLYRAYAIRNHHPYHIEG